MANELEKTLLGASKRSVNNTIDKNSTYIEQKKLHKVYITSQEPESPADGEIWFDTTGNGIEIYPPYNYDGTYGPVPDSNGLVNLTNYALKYIPEYQTAAEIPKENLRYLKSGLKASNCSSMFYNMNGISEIDFDSFEASQMVFNRYRFLSTLKMKPLELAIYALNANNGEYFDIKHGNPYKGSQFGEGKYVSRRDAGNILAGMVARRGGLSAKMTYTAFGALQLAGNNRWMLPMYLLKAANQGPKGFYGETPISHIFQKRGYELNFK